MSYQSPLWSNATNVTLQNIIVYAQSFPEVYPVLSHVAGQIGEPALSFANDVMQRILAQGMDWKWNRKYIPSILTVGLQQDYVTQVTDLGWLETGWSVDINNSTNNGNLAPKPNYELEVARDIQQSPRQGGPTQISYIPNRLAIMGVWSPNTPIGCGYGNTQAPVSPIQQFVDPNRNILYIDSTMLGLSINSPGFAGQTIPLPTPNPYGVTGSTIPSLPPNSPAGTTITDGTVTWTVADPNGYAIRVHPLPPVTGLVYLITPVYQAKAIWFATTNQTLAPLPNEYTYLFREGFLAKCLMHSGNAKYTSAYAEWEETMMTALRAADREQSNTMMVPSEGLLSRGYGLPLGPAWPFDSPFGNY